LTDIAATLRNSPQLKLDDYIALAEEAELKGNRIDAARHFAAAFRLAFGHGRACLGLQRIAKTFFADAIAARHVGRIEDALELLVRSIELNPGSNESRAELTRLLGVKQKRDMTSECLIFPDATRALRFYGDAIQTAIDFCVYGGVVGDIYEFGVLAGWTARLFAVRMRDSQFYGDLYLFDSFQGLPRQKSFVDKASYDVTRGIWQDEMEFPESIIAELGMPIDSHIRTMLSRIISRDRIHIRKGFFSDTLQIPLQTKAAIVHFDCDLYQSTIEVFEALKRDDILQDGTILMFDDWNCNRANPAFGQRRALREFLNGSNGRYAVSNYLNYGFNCAAFILHDFMSVPEGLRPNPTAAGLSGSF